MQFNPITLAATIVGGLIVAAILGWIRKPRLVVLVPRSFSYSQITDRGHLVEISIFNRGFKTEEAIDVMDSKPLLGLTFATLPFSLVVYSMPYVFGAFAIALLWSDSMSVLQAIWLLATQAS